ncbi:uncharacterized protein MONBRDRAFT_30887 [Monosiga brevicollis MX1]|uniref:Bacterial surface antigen (D15) domain-containing protein n=1 Tax=Monosiga brevicollis TaxID=81824 RepID=A9UPZ3_MONBE|nr:uncharacterized protein MONBRDRAFT_30887 [Monosiga brevicollis MX1]EDQ92958.1 predicted protein [Monosiga brevicollis MX1]|eukprot:XP_001742720.1 hypothetical protein [Monosiga brevicollis MX1]
MAEASEANMQDLIEVLQRVLEDNKDRKVRVRNVHIDGVKRTAPWLLQQQAAPLLECTTLGDVLEEADYTCSKIKSLNVFPNVSAEVDRSLAQPLQDDGVEELDINFQIRESRLVSGGTGVTVGNNQGTATFSINLNNLAGVADQVSFTTSRTSKGQVGYQAAYSLPFLGSPFSPLRFELAKTQLELQQHGAFLDNRYAAVELQQRYFGVDHSFRLESSWRHIHRAAADVPFLLREQMGHTLKNAASYTLKMQAFPESDQFDLAMRISAEAAGGQLGGDIHHSKIEASADAQSIWDLCTLRLSGRLGYGTAQPLPLAVKQATPHRPLHLADRYCLGGVLNVRGFKHMRIGDAAGTYAQGGSAYWAAAAHAYFPFPKLQDTLGSSVQLHAFANAGSVASQAKQLWHPGRIAASYGLGIFAQAQLCQLELNYTLPFQTGGAPTQPGFSIAVGWEFL